MRDCHGGSGESLSFERFAQDGEGGGEGFLLMVESRSWDGGGQNCLFPEDALNLCGYSRVSGRGKAKALTTEDTEDTDWAASASLPAFVERWLELCRVRTSFLSDPKSMAQNLSTVSASMRRDGASVVFVLVMALCFPSAGSAAAGLWPAGQPGAAVPTLETASTSTSSTAPAASVRLAGVDSIIQQAVAEGNIPGAVLVVGVQRGSEDRAGPLGLRRCSPGTSFARHGKRPVRWVCNVVLQGWPLRARCVCDGCAMGGGVTQFTGGV